ncbi:MFS transporter [Pseudomonas sp. CC120222-01a]|uniref:MFS transporter n=1 Tax=Pseudomonas sp. CC120222-01a TaxID=1378075 RepID=UPI000D86C61C|nr:MFS transporter [Pseudomonas sp. CC120222-01a]PVZ39704.1 putative MFS transporter [Pseudomonas sp. CC120222-01a]
MSNTTLSIEDAPLNNFHQLMTVRAGGGWILDGYILSIIGVVIVQFSDYLKLDSFWQGMVAASAMLGTFCSGFLGGWLTDKVGRRRLFFVGPILFMVGSLGSLWVESGIALFILRFLVGVGVGLEYPVAGSLLTEFLPQKHRGQRLAGLTILWFAGAALSYMVGNFILARGGDEAWRLVLASSAVLGALLFIIRLRTPESPRWLVSKGRHEEAERIIKKVYGPSYSLANMPEQAEENKVSLGDLMRSGYGKRMLFVAVFWSSAVVPMFAVYSFAPVVLQALNLKGDWASYGSVLITLLFVVGCIIATRLIDTLGRRPLIIHSFLWSTLALLGLGLFSNSSEALVLLMFGAYALFIGGAQVLELVYPNELFPTEIRAFAVGMGSSMSRIGSAAGTWLVPVSLLHLGIGNTMLVAALVSLAGLVVSVWLAPETRGMSLEMASSLER